MTAQRTRSKTMLITGSALLSLIVIMALVSIIHTPYAPSDTSGGRLQPPSTGHWAGTDMLGQDFLTQLLIGARLAVETGTGATVLATFLGTIVGLLAAFTSGGLDDLLASLLDLAIAVPTLLLAMIIVLWRGASLGSSVLAIGLAGSAVISRITRIAGKKILTTDYLLAAKLSGSRIPRMLREHLLPNLWPILLVPIGLQFGSSIITEASLSFLGLGSPPPNPSWGRLLQQSQSYVLIRPEGAVLPGLLIVISVVGANMLADGLREFADPSLS